MRTAIQLRKDWLKRLQFNDDYKIKIFIMCSSELPTNSANVSLHVELYSTDELIDTECIRTECLLSPSKIMLHHAYTLFRFFNTYFDNVSVIENVIVV